MGVPQINYNPGSGANVFNFQRGPQNFIAEDMVTRHDNLATIGLRESVYERTDILISFTMPGLLLASGGDFADWKNFYSWALQGGLFIFAPNTDVTYAPSPWSGSLFYFDCVLEDTGFKPKRVGLGRYSLDCKFRVVPDNLRPSNSGMVMDAFWGLTPA